MRTVLKLHVMKLGRIFVKPKTLFVIYLFGSLPFCHLLVLHIFAKKIPEFLDKIVKCITPRIARNYILTKAKGVGKFAIRDILDNSKANLLYNEKIDARAQCKHNRLDLLLIDKCANTWFVVEIGSSSMHEYDQVEN